VETSRVRIGVLAKQVPRFEELALGLDRRLRRDGLDLEINPYCRRAIAKGVELAAATGGGCTVFTLGPPDAAEVLREAVAWGADEGVLITDAAFAGSDTLATAKALAAAIGLVGPFDLIIAGLSSVDADTGQVGPQIAEFLGLPLLSGVRKLSIEDGVITARCEREDGHQTARTELPAVLTVAERLCAPAKVPPDKRGIRHFRTLTAADLGPGPWGRAAGRTTVGEVRLLGSRRRRHRLTGTASDQVRTAVEMIRASGAMDGLVPAPAPAQVTTAHGASVVVLAEDGTAQVTRELLGAAARLGGSTVLFSATGAPSAWSWGADRIVRVPHSPEDAAGVVGDGCKEHPWAILAPSTTWGREVAGRLAVRLDAGLTGDAVELEARGEALVCWKSAFGGQAVVAVTADSAVQMVTVRPGVLPPPEPRRGQACEELPYRGPERRRVRVTDRVSDDDPARLATARAVVGVGQGVDPDRYDELQPLLSLLDGELAASRKVTDQGWLPRSRQVGITGRAVAPGLYLALGMSGRFNHMVGVRAARFVLAVNTDTDAAVFDAADAGIVGDWAEIVALLVKELGEHPV
jgi:electron transfer flavoprotein alpha subunit